MRLSGRSFLEMTAVLAEYLQLAKFLLAISSVLNERFVLLSGLYFTLFNFTFLTRALRCLFMLGESSLWP